MKSITSLFNFGAELFDRDPKPNSYFDSDLEPDPVFIVIRIRSPEAFSNFTKF